MKQRKGTSLDEGRKRAAVNRFAEEEGRRGWKGMEVMAVKNAATNSVLL